jgi:regulator of sirC expression with transglutaminase-like and TPR domain
MADVLMQLEEPELAYQALTRCIQLDPEGEGTPYLNLAQMSEGHEALSFYSKGLELLVKKRAALFAEVHDHSLSSCRLSPSSLPSHLFLSLLLSGCRRASCRRRCWS